MREYSNHLPRRYIMSFAVITSASNTVTKSLGAVDNVVDGVSLATEIFKETMQTARLEQQIESMVEANKLIADSGLPEEQILMLKASL
jgi:hypothetical protein